jgi:teichuronic acid biosynthesis glycosyltransferase TuaC
MIRLVTFGHLYPSAARPHYGVFVETRLRRLLAQGGVESRVVSPAPWFPFAAQLSGGRAHYISVPRNETRHGVPIEYPKWLVVPKIGMLWQPRMMAAVARPILRRFLAEGYAFDAIDAQYFFPDGYAAMLLAREFGVPFTVTARGTDLNLVPKHKKAGAMVREAAMASSANICVAKALRDVLDDMGVPPEKTYVFRNGVDLELFRPVERDVERAALGFKRRTLLSVGHLVPRKGHDLVIDALRELPDCELFVIGTGPEEGRLKERIAAHGLADRARLVGRVDQAELRRWYGAADALVLASDREGWANVLLETMACGTPVVATAIWGTPEVVAAPEAGVLVPERTAASVADGLRRLFAAPPDRAATRRYAERFSWDETARGLKALFERVTAGRRAS